MLLLRIWLLYVVLLLFESVRAGVPVAEAVKWLQLPPFSGVSLSTQMAATMVEAHRARHRIALEALLLPQPRDRTLFVAQNTEKLYDKVRIHVHRLLAAKAKVGADTQVLTAALHAGIRAGEQVIQSTPIRELFSTPLPRAMATWRRRLAEWWRNWNALTALRDWRAHMLLQQSGLPKLKTLLEADVERHAAQLMGTQTRK